MVCSPAPGMANPTVCTPAFVLLNRIAAAASLLPHRWCSSRGRAEGAPGLPPPSANRRRCRRWWSGWWRNRRARTCAAIPRPRAARRICVAMIRPPPSDSSQNCRYDDLCCEPLPSFLMSIIIPKSMFANPTISLGNKLSLSNRNRRVSSLCRPFREGQVWVSLVKEQAECHSPVTFSVAGCVERAAGDIVDARTPRRRRRKSHSTVL